MSESAGDRVQDLFDQAVALPTEQRAAFLEAACAGDSAVRAEVESLLACDADFPEGAPEGLLESPLVRSPEPTTPRAGEPLPAAGSLGLPVQVGHYRILRRIAEGGMGAVYEALQDHPRRAVALKVIRPGLASATLLKRFSHEAQILGRLHHPGIAQVYEAGLADDGQPFFAMEFIRGLPLDEYASRQRLDVSARVGLLARVCDAVQHAHDQGVIHRDLKPANILVEETGQPKVLDFGVARATDIDLLTGAGLTQTGQLLGTPSYMSPEQVTADPAAIDHRADVYALGVVLFELLAQRLPYRLENQPLAEAARLILEQDSPGLGSIIPELRGDVETIVAKALEKDPARRYPSAADLAADLRRWLAQEPILARPPSALYHLRKFARRHKTLVGGVAATGVALILGLIGTILFAVDARQNARRATEKEKEARYQTYRARVAAANAALNGHDVADAARHLEEAPEELRGWEWHHLHSRLDDSSGQIMAASGATFILVRRPDGIQVGQLVPEAGLRLTDLDGQQLRTIPRSAEIKGDGRVLQASGGLRFLQWRDNTMPLVWGEEIAPHLRLSLGHSSCLNSDGSRLASLTRDPAGRENISLYETASGKRTATLGAHKAQIWALTFSQDGTRVASADDDGLACVWDAATAARIAACLGHTSKILSAAFRPDGARLVTTSADGTVRQWDPATGREVEPPYERHSGDVRSAVYSPDGEWIASGGADRTIRLWRAKGRQDFEVLHGHTGAVTEVAFNPDGRRIVSVSQDRGRGWAEGDKTVRVWDVHFQAGLPVLHGHTKDVYPVAYSPDGQWIASGSWDHTLRLWDARTGEPWATLHHTGNVRALAFSPDSLWLVCGCDGKAQLQVWDVATGQRRQEVKGPGKVLLAVAVNANGTRIAAVDRDGRARITESTTGREIASWRVDPGRVTKKALAYSPDGHRLAGTGEDAQVIDIWDAQTHQRTVRLAGHTGPVFSVAFSPDGRRLVSASGDRTVRVWDVATAKEVAVLSGHTDEVFTAAFHPDGRRLATAGRDRAVWLWDLTTGQEVARLQGHTNYVLSLAFSPDGKSLVSGSGDGTVRLWDTAPLKTRYQARREIESVRPEAALLVDRLFAELREPGRVVSQLREGSLSAPLHRAALQEVLRRGSK